MSIAGERIASMGQGRGIDTRIGEIVNERRAISADTGLRLSRYFGRLSRYFGRLSRYFGRLSRYFWTTPQFWLNLQAGYDLSRVQCERGAEIERDVHPRAA